MDGTLGTAANTALPMARPRLHCLDSVRGLAALTVLINHCLLLYPATIQEQIFAIAKFTPFLIFTNGHAAVIIFFALSGYVLSLPFFADGPLPYKQYLVKRFCRLYLPFAAAVCLSVFLWLLSAHVPVVSLGVWFQENWPDPPLMGRQVLSHFFMEGTKFATRFDGPTWSLAHEMRISIIFPVLVLISRKSGRAIALGLLLFFVSTVLLELFGDGNINVTPDSSLAAWILTLRYVPFFLMGVLLAKHAATLGAIIRRLPWWMYAACWAASYVAICKHVRSDWVLAYFGDLFIALGSAGLILLTLHSPRASHFLEKGPAHWLGRVSYSLYLIHVPVLSFVGYQLAEKVGTSAIAATAIASSLVLAEIMFRWIEQPAIALGKWLVARAVLAGAE
jgi:peptidoglycan/LPS O-acetylase OafA/YrhL